MNHHEQHKRRSVGFRNANDSRLARAGRHKEERRLYRAENVARHRKFAGNAEREDLSSRPVDTGARLRKWKEEQRLRKKMEEQKKKPIFKVGIVRHKIYSPPFSDRFTKKTQPDNPKGAKRLLTKSFAPPNCAFTVPSGVIEIPMFGRIAGASPNVAGWTQIMKGRLEWQTAVVRLSQASSAPVTTRNSSSVFRPRSSSKDESIEEANHEDKSSSEVADFVDRQVAQVLDVRTATSRSGTPVFLFSPYVLTSRGKDNARNAPTNRTSIRASSANEISLNGKEKKFEEDVLLEEVPAAEPPQALINSNRNLGRALVRTCSYDSNDNFVEPYDTMRNVTVRTVKKRLDFENESFDECENTNTAGSAATLANVSESTVIPNIVLTIPTPAKRPMQTPSKHNRSNVIEVRTPVNRQRCSQPCRNHR